MTMGMATRVFPFGTQNGIDADPTLRELRENEPVCQVRMADGALAWLVTRYEDVRYDLGATIGRRTRKDGVTVR